MPYEIAHIFIVVIVAFIQGKKDVSESRLFHNIFSVCMRFSEYFDLIHAFFLVFQNKIHTSANWLQTAFELAGFVSQEIVCYLSSFLVQYARLLNLIVLKNTDNNSIEEKKIRKAVERKTMEKCLTFRLQSKDFSMHSSMFSVKQSIATFARLSQSLSRQPHSVDANSHTII